jgi:t-SNARE complex subunit (syntaxin)
LPQKGKTNGTMRSCLRINTGHSSQGKGNTVTAVNVRKVVKKKISCVSICFFFFFVREIKIN